MKKEVAGRAEIIAVGSELLTPHFQDTNSLYLSARLNDLGWTVVYKTIVGDDPDNLRSLVQGALRRTELVIVMGGLGPTGDDITREAVARALGKDLVLDRSVLERIAERFRSRQIPLHRANRKQAFIIRGAAVLPNDNGTAPGQLIEVGKKRVVLLPGPFHELKPMCEKSVWPLLGKERRGYISRVVLKATGLTESMAEALISDLYPKSSDLGLTILASPGQVEVHLTAFSKVSRLLAEAKLRRLKSRICGRLRTHIFSEAGESLEQVVGLLLIKQKMTLAVAESCTGGLISHRLTNVPGSSAYFLEGAVAYSNAAKVDLLAVPPGLIESYGAVSFFVARAMASGVRRRARADLGLAVTGIAGPDGGTPEKPVGLVFIALSWPGGVEVQKNLFPGKREQVKRQSAQRALDMVRRHLLQKAREGGKRSR
jgi:competence/damage-inducible protein CinA-like protein